MAELSILHQSEEIVVVPGWNEDIKDVVEISIVLDKSKSFVCTTFSPHQHSII